MSEEFQSRMRMDAAERFKLLARLDESDARSGGHERRRHKRWEYRRSDIAVLVQHPGGGAGRYLVCARNLSAGGISFIHGGYLHPGSACRIVLPRRDGLPLPVGGTIVHCRHVEGCFHEIGIRFSEELDPAALLPDAVGREDEIRDQTREMPALDGQILVVDPSQTDRNLMAHQLRTTGAALTMVDSTGAALEALNRRDFDAVVCDLGLDGERLRMMKRMRGAGYKGPIIVLTADNAAARLTQARAAGADEILGKPCDPQYLAAVLGERLEAAPVDRPIYSSLEDTPGMPDLIVDFIEQAQRAAQQIEKSLEAGELVGMREICLRLAGSGAGFGFGTVTGAARDAQTALDTAQDRNAMTAPLRRLAAICRRLRCANTVRPTRDQWAMAS